MSSSKPHLNPETPVSEIGQLLIDSSDDLLESAMALAHIAESSGNEEAAKMARTMHQRSIQYREAAEAALGSEEDEAA